jgi:Tol biopolymer transport system component
MKSDGSAQQMLSSACGAKLRPGCAEDHGAKYSPDGRSIAFVRFPVTGRASLAIGDTRLRSVRLLYPFGRQPGIPGPGGVAWSPDGKQIAFSADNGKRYKPVNGLAIFVINVDGTGLRRLTPWSLRAGGDSDSLDWSPDGAHILFRTVVVKHEEPGPSTGNLYTVRPNGSDLHRLTDFPAGTPVQLGSYSPDGTSVVFTTGAGATTTSGSTWPDVFVIKADGTGLTPVTRTRNWEGTPDWGP